MNTETNRAASPDHSSGDDEDNGTSSSDPVVHKRKWTRSLPVRHRLAVHVALALGVGLVTRFLSAGFSGPISNDAASFYLPNARALVENGLFDYSALNGAIPPLFPTLVAFLAPFFSENLEYSALSISIVSSTLVAVPAALIARRVVPRPRVVDCVVWIAALNPFLLTYGGDAKADAFYALLFSFAAYFGFETIRTLRYRDGMLFGLLVGAAYLVRPEALLLPTLVALWVSARQVRSWLGRSEQAKRHLRSVLLCGTLSFLFLVPSLAWNVAYVRQTIGVWSLSPKAGLLQDYGNGGSEDSLNRLNEARTHTLYDEQRLDPGRFRGFSVDGESLTGASNRWAAAVGHWIEAVRTLPPALGIFGSLMFLIGLIRLRRHAHRRALLWIFAVVAGSLLMYSSFYFSRRFWLYLIPLVFGISALGFWTVLSRSQHHGLARTLFWTLFIGLGLGEGLDSALQGEWFSSPEKRLGASLSIQFGPGQKIVSSKGRVAFYANGENLPLPSDPLPLVAEYMSNRESRFLVVDLERLERRRPDFARDLSEDLRFEIIDVEESIAVLEFTRSR